MNKIENKKIYAIVAAILYLVCAMYNIIDDFAFLLKDIVDVDEISILFYLRGITYFAMIGMAVTLFLRKDKAVVIAFGVNALITVFWSITYMGILNLLSFVSYASLTALLFLAFNGNTIVKRIWFIPIVISLLQNLISWGTYFNFVLISYYWQPMLLAITEIVAILFVSIWLKENIAPAKAKPATPINEYAKFNQQTACSGSVASDIIGGADKLKLYKDLLDSGAITQEEFDIKKKQILDM